MSTESATSANKTHSDMPTGRDEIRAAVLDAADLLFASRRPSLVSIREIAAQAGVNHALVHRHFDAKENLVSEALARAEERLALEWEHFTDAIDVAEYILRNHELYGQSLLMLEGSVMDGDTEGASSKLLDGLSERLQSQGMQEEDAGMAAVTAVSLLLGWATYGKWLSSAAHLASEQEQVESTVVAALEGILRPDHQ
ncbi:MAG: TetR/AcrR family transcriptional regulator [Acidimicrobiia bacterium]|nr:TetR/AcrR family transcriptional regulator [Acidimicrobiia bacterium]